jgi:DNA-binding CsgD family transcriptional regulator
VPPTLTEIQRIARRLASAESRTDKIRAERDAAIVAAHAGGESPKLIAIAAGISEMTVFKILRQARDRTE